MKCFVKRVEGREAFVVPISDTHIGDKGFDKDGESKLKGYIEWIVSTPNAFATLNGDILNCATRTSKSNPHEQTENLEEQLDHATRLLKPLADAGKILAIVTGNHELRIGDYAGYDATISLCEKLGCRSLYGERSAVVEIILDYGNTPHSFLIYQHHTTGGGRTSGSKVNRVEMLMDIFVGADIYIGSHNHALFAVPHDTFTFDKRRKCISRLEQWLVGAGGYLKWKNTYAESAMLPPLKTGSPKIELGLKIKGSQRTKDIHISI